MLTHPIFGQVKDIVITSDYKNMSWEKFVLKVEQNNPVQFFYNNVDIPQIEITFNGETIFLETLLRKVLEQQKLYFTYDKSGNIFISKTRFEIKQLPDGFFDSIIYQKNKKVVEEEDVRRGSEYISTNKNLITQTFTIGNNKDGAKSRYFTLSGYLKSAVTGEPIVGGRLIIKETGAGTTTDDKGFYTLTLKKGTYTLEVNSLESKEQKVRIIGLSNGTLDFTLDENQYMLDEVEINSAVDDNVRGIQMGYEKLSSKELKEVPVVLGERDIIKVALLLPGVQVVGEGAAGFNVRGSPADQNMFYVSKIPVYNTSHLFGFFSSFNPDLIDDFVLYKSNIPAKYGGRLSSIFDIKTKQGRQDHFSARGGISPVAARLMVEGPIIKDKLSYIAGVRTTYSNWIMRSLADPILSHSTAYFGDLNFGLSYNPDNNNQIKLYSYYSNDQVNLYPSNKYDYSNAGASAEWTHIFEKKQLLDVSLQYSYYQFNGENTEYAPAAFSQGYNLQQTELNASYKFNLGEKHNLNAGLTSILYLIDNGDFLPLNSESDVKPVYLGNEKGVESAIFISDEWKPFPLLTIYGGLRYNLYGFLGPKTVFEYAENKPKIAENIVDTLYFGNNQLVKGYSGLDYRFAVNYLLTPDFSVKASFNRLHQYIFMLSNTIAISPTDKWKLVDYNIEPMVGDQASVGFYSSLFRGRIEASVEGYYKTVNNLVDYKDGADLLVNEFPERDVLQGNLEAYGVEFMIRKPTGKMNGWVNYTYSSANIIVNRPESGESINYGIEYPANYEKPHAFNLVFNYKVARRVSFSTNIVYSTGRPITYPTSIYYQDGQPILNYSMKNEYRLPDYFRIDASATLEGNLAKKKFMHGSWIFSIYNLTGRKNAYSVYFKTEDGKISSYRLSIFGSPIFSITYDFKLGNFNE